MRYILFSLFLLPPHPLFADNAKEKKPTKKAEKKKDAPKDPDPPYKPDKIDGTF